MVGINILHDVWYLTRTQNVERIAVVGVFTLPHRHNLVFGHRTGAKTQERKNTSGKTKQSHTTGNKKTEEQ